MKEKKPFPFGYLLFALTFMVIGVAVIVFTAQARDVIHYFIGGVTIFAAAISAVLVLARKERGAAFFAQIVLCAFGVIAGVVMLIADETIEYVVAVSALLLIIESSFKLQTTVRMREVKAPLWWAVVVLIVVSYFGNAFLIKFYNAESVEWMLRILGVLLVLDGILNLLTPIMLAAIERKRAALEKEEPAPAPESEPEPVAETPVEGDKEE